MTKNIAIAFDFETWDYNKNGTANSETSNLTQIAAVPVDLDKMIILKDELLNILVKPKDIGQATFVKQCSNVLDFHCRVLGKTMDELVEHLKNGVKEEDAITEFCNFCKEFKGRKNPIAVTHNGTYFDLPILRRKCKEYKKTYPLNKVEEDDTKTISAQWFRYCKNPPINMKADTIFMHIGIDPKGSHDAAVDVMNMARYYLAFERLRKNLLVDRADEQWVKILNGAHAISNAS